MRIKGSKKKFWFAVVTLFLVVALVVTGAMVLYSPSIQNVIKNTTAQADVILSRGEAAESETDYHTISQERLETLYEDGLVQMQFDKVSMAPVILETTEQNAWRSLPLADGVEHAQSAVLTLEVSAKGGKRYILNSQDNSVAMGNATVTTDASKKRVSVHYIIAQTKDDALKEKERLKKVAEDKNAARDTELDYMAFSLTVNYTLKDGSFFAEVDCSNLLNRSGSKVLSLSLLPGFGSSREEVSDGFLLVPDGSGALIDLNKKVETFSPLEFKVYGGEPGTQETSAAKSQTVLPVFGIRQKKNAFLAIVEQGDALSTITAQRATGGDYPENRVFSSFAITPNSRTLVKGVGDKTNSYTDYVGEQAYQGKLSVCYRFLTQSNANYSGMAVSCREQLMRNGTLGSSEVANADYLPFHLSVIGEAKTRNTFAGVSFNDTQVLTTYDQAADMVKQMRVKGINNISLRYINMLDGNGSVSSGLNSSLGSRRKLSALYDYMNSEKLSLYVDINLLGMPGGTLSRDSAYGLDGKPLRYASFSAVAGKAGQSTSTNRLRRMETIDSAVESFLTRSAAWPVSGVCVQDAGSLLYTDMSKGGASRTELKEKLSGQAAPLSVNRKLMVDTGNVYMLRGADSVVNMPLTSTHSSKDGSYVSIPFLQMVVHGLLDYAGTPINTAENYKTAMLRSVEYGACPSFLWSYGDTSLLSKDNHTYYADWLVRATDYYVKANEALYDLRGARMTDHYEVADQVFCTVYDNRYRVYVNYNEKEVQVDGLVIPAEDFLKL